VFYQKVSQKVVIKGNIYSIVENIYHIFLYDISQINFNKGLSKVLQKVSQKVVIKGNIYSIVENLGHIFLYDIL
jgi:hypothetical protein